VVVLGGGVALGMLKRDDDPAAIRTAMADRTVPLLPRPAQDAAAADIPTTDTTLRQLVDERGVLPPRLVIPQLPWTVLGPSTLTGARA
jgi:hypothetical protein